MESVNGLAKVSVDLSFLVGSLLAVRSVRREHSNDLVQKSIDNTSNLMNSRRNTELGLLVNGDESGGRVGDRVHQLKQTLHELLRGSGGLVSSGQEKKKNVGSHRHFML